MARSIGSGGNGNNEDSTPGTGADGPWLRNNPGRARSRRLDQAAVTQLQDTILGSSGTLSLADDVSDTEFKEAQGKAAQLTERMLNVFQDVTTRFGQVVPGDRVTGDNVRARRQEITWQTEVANEMGQKVIVIGKTSVLLRAELSFDYDWLMEECRKLAEANPDNKLAARVYKLLLDAKTKEQDQVQQNKRDNLRIQEGEQQAKDDLSTQLAAAMKKIQELEGLLATRPAKDPAPTPPAPGTGHTKPAKPARSTKSTGGASPGRRKTPRK